MDESVFRERWGILPSGRWQSVAGRPRLHHKSDKIEGETALIARQFAFAGPAA